MKISAVVNTYNEEANIARCLTSLPWADELIVWDAESTDKTVEIAKTFTPHVSVHHYDQKYVEPQRNDAIAKASGDWILIVDADEEIPAALKDKLIELANKSEADAYTIPRKNIIFNKWIEHSGWWPDPLIRFFRKGHVTWANEIHAKPNVNGTLADLPADPQLAIVHYHYTSISQYVLRMDNYTTIQAQEIVASEYKFAWTDLIKKPVSEFITRYFAWEGYKDGLHGLTLSLMQAFSFFILYLKVWQQQGFMEVPEKAVTEKLPELTAFTAHEMDYWQAQTVGKKRSILKRLLK